MEFLNKTFKFVYADSFGMQARKASFKIVIRKVEQPFSSDFDHEFNWLCNSFGFLPMEAQSDSGAAQIFREIVIATEKGKPLTSTRVAEKVGMSRGAAINHLNNLMRSGLVVKDGRFYLARSRSMYRTIQEIQEDIERIFKRMEETAKRIDREFGIGFEDE